MKEILMKLIIQEALKEVEELIEKQVPKTKDSQKEIDVGGVNPYEVVEFMQKHNIPKLSYFGVEGNEGSERIVIYWYIKVPTTEKDKLEYKRRRFQHLAFSCLYKKLIANGYKRCSCWSHKFKEFDDTSVYDMYINKDFDRLVKYYSLSFEPKTEQKDN